MKPSKQAQPAYFARLRRILAGVLITTVVLSGAARPNDSSAELAAGGLVLVRTNKVAIQREDLSLSAETVRVRYEMRNDSSAPVTLRVAFPLPPLPVDTSAGLDVLDAMGMSAAHNIKLPSQALPNFVDFRVWADGDEITPEMELRALLPDGRDIAATLRDIGAGALLLHPKVLIQSDAAYRIDPGLLQKLLRLGAVHGDADSAAPLWQTRVTFHWQQRFRPGVTVIAHRYHPVVGSSFVTREHAVWTGGAIGSENLERAYCLDSAAKQELARLQPPGGLLSGQFVDYVLSTGANWAGPIGLFHLVVEGQAAEIVSLCSEIPLRRSGKVRLEGQAVDFLPRRDLRVLIVPRRRTKNASKRRAITHVRRRPGQG